MNCWEFLELAPTKDRTAVKRAYARLLRKYHPEDDAEGFKNLRRAYDMAIEQIVFQELWDRKERESDSRDSSFANNVSDSLKATPSTFHIITDPRDAHAANHADSGAKALDELLEKTRHILNSRNECDNKESWENLFADPLLWNLEKKMEFSNRLFFLLYEKKCHDPVSFTMPFTVWRTIDTHLHWREREIQLYRMVDESKAHLVMDPIWRAYQDNTVPRRHSKTVRKEIQRTYRSDPKDFPWWGAVLLLMLMGRIGGIISEYTPKYGQDSFKKDPTTASTLFLSGLESEKKGYYSEAAEWFTKAANQGQAEAQYRLGLLYEQGKGVVQSYPEAFKWYGTAARHANPDAQFRLGMMYEYGRGVKQDYVAAYMWLSLSIKYHVTFSDTAKIHLADIRNHLTDQQQTLVEDVIGAWTPTLKFPLSPLKY